MKKITITIIAIFTWCAGFSQRKLDTIPVLILVSDTTVGYIVSYWKAYSIRELHNTSEGQNDAGFCPDCWKDYWLHIKYLDKNKKPLRKGIIVWMYKVVQ